MVGNIYEDGITIITMEHDSSSHSYVTSPEMTLSALELHLKKYNVDRLDIHDLVSIPQGGPFSTATRSRLVSAVFGVFEHYDHWRAVAREREEKGDFATSAPKACEIRMSLWYNGWLRQPSPDPACDTSNLDGCLPSLEIRSGQIKSDQCFRRVIMDLILKFNRVSVHSPEFPSVSIHLHPFAEKDNGRPKGPLTYQYYDNGVGIGPLWILYGVLLYDDKTEDFFYGGENGNREYKNLFPDLNVSYMPLENDGGAGTAIVHPEEGHEEGASKNNRYFNGIFHPGLDTELMTGWAERGEDVINLPLSRVTIGMIEDLGYSVDYDAADKFIINYKKK